MLSCEILIIAIIFNVIEINDHKHLSKHMYKHKGLTCSCTTIFWFKTFTTTWPWTTSTFSWLCAKSREIIITCTTSWNNMNMPLIEYCVTFCFKDLLFLNTSLLVFLVIALKAHFSIWKAHLTIWMDHLSIWWNLELRYTRNTGIEMDGKRAHFMKNARIFR